MSQTSAYTSSARKTMNTGCFILMVYRHGFHHYELKNREIFINFAHYQQYVNKVGISMCDSIKPCL